MTQFLNAALALAAHGLLVFPLQPNAKEPHPGSSGFKDASTDQGKLTGWWQKGAKSNIGVATGTASGFFVVDVDVKGEANGFDSLKELGDIDAIGTLFVTTPSGGRHYYLSAEDLMSIRTSAGVVPGVDVRGEGGYVLAPPSVIDGNGYTWGMEFDLDSIRHQIKPAPEWLLDALVRKVPAPSTEVTLTFDDELTLKDGSQLKMSEAEVGKQYRCRCPFHDDKKGDASFTRKGERFGVLHCFYCSETWRVRGGVQKSDLKWDGFDEKNRPLGYVKNTKMLFDHYGISCRYNEMTKAIEIETAGERFLPDLERNAAVEFVADCARRVGYRSDVAQSNLVLVANERSYHPARDWVLSAEWDGVDRYPKVYDALVHAPEMDASLKEMLIRRWLRACIALLMHSTVHQSAEHRQRGFLGTEGILVLQGKQGLKKTQFFQSLVPANTGYFQDGVTLDPNNKDSVAQVVSHWIVELGELDSIFRKADVAALRAWLTKKFDEYRPPYAKEMNRYPRRTAVCATVNQKPFLPELGENRRYWVIPVTEVNRLEDVDLQQLWAQACHEYREGKRFWLEPDERKLLYRSNQMFERKPPIIQLLELHVRDPHDPPVPASAPVMLRYLDVDDVPSATPAGPKPPVLIGEVLNVSQIYHRLTGRTEPNRSEILTSITDWLTERHFRTATNRRFHVAFVDMPDEGRGNPFD